MRKKAGLLLIITGTALLLSALSLVLYNWYADIQAGRNAKSLLAGVQSIMEERKADNTALLEMETAISESVEALDPELPVVELEGYAYVGTISIPTLELELPVMSEWDYERLRIAPCRQFGSSRTDDLVIAAHNYKNHFGLLKQLSVGEAAIFTDMDGVINDYAVVKTEILQPTDVNTVYNSGHDLVLYTCTKGGKSRVVVFCDRV
ncbi:sortase [Hominifimenecus sp. rT4P-3]|uniref:sortase n=1 Tax=Hominifimenecus sp. rT4P-3 TaxID=3242979 RepID=UPI003DA55A19